MKTNKTYIIFLALPFFIFFCAAALFASEAKLKDADEYLRKKEYLKAKQIYRDVYLSSKEAPLLEKALWGTIKCDYRLKHYFETRLNIQRLFSVYPRTEYVYEAYLMLGHMSLDLKEFKSAKEYFKRVEGPLREISTVGEAELALKTGDNLKAETLLAGVGKKALENEPRAVYLRALIYSKKGMHNEAVSHISRLSELSLREEELRVGKAQILLNADKLTEAGVLLEKIIAAPFSRNESLEAKRLLFQLYDKENRTDDALKLSRDLFSGDAQDGFKLRVVSLYDRKGDMDNALRYLIYLKDRGARSAEIEKRLKKAVSSNDNKTPEYLQKYIGYIKPGSPFTVDASRYLIRSGKKLEGMALLKSSMSGANREEALLAQAEAYIEEAKYDEAGKILGPLVKDKRYGHRASLAMAEMHADKGEYALAVRYLAAVVKESRDSRTASLLGDMCWKTGDRANALMSYVLASERGDGASSVKAGDIYYMEGDTKKATLYYGRALKTGVKTIDNQSLQWAAYQYGKLANNRDYLKKAAGGGGEIAAAASVILGE